MMTNPEAPRQAFLDNFTAFLRLVLSRFGRDGGMRIAAALSYTSLLALVPLAAIAFAVLKAFPVFQDLQGRIQALVFENFLPETISDVSEHFTGFVSNAADMTAIGVIALAVVAIMLLATIETALNDIFRVHHKRAFVPRMMVFWAVLTMGPILLGGSISVATYLFALSKTVGVDQLSGFGWFVTQMLPTVLTVFAFSVFYAIVPNRPVRMYHALIGGLVAGILFALVRKGFAIYIVAFPAYQTLYGALSTIPIFLIWMYLSWAVVLIGAEVTAVLPEWGRPAREGEALLVGPTQRLEAALVVLETLWRQRRGETTAGPEDEDSPLNADVTSEVLDDLRGAGFVALADDEQWFLKRDLGSATLGDLARALSLTPDAGAVGRGEYVWQERLQTALANTGGWNIHLQDLFNGH